MTSLWLRQGYGSVPTQSPGEATGLYQDDDDLFREYKDMSPAATSHNNPHLPAGNTSNASTSTVKPTAPKKDDWDDWKEF